MKLLIATGIYPPEIGGPAGYVKGLATELVARGHSIQVVTYGSSETHNGSGFDVAVISSDSSLVVRYLRYALAVRRLSRKVDLVFLQGPVSEGLPGAIGAILAGKEFVLKVVGDYAWEQYQQTSIINNQAPITNPNSKFQIPNSNLEPLDEFLKHRHSGKVWLMEAIERWVAKRAKTIIVPSQYLKTVVERWGIDARKIHVVYNSIAPLPFEMTAGRDGSPGLRSTSPEDDKNETVVNLGGSKKIILTAVRAVPWKGGDFLCDCIKELPSDFVLAVAGDGPNLENWKRHAQEIGVADRVMWLGRLSREELAAWYRRADLFVLATGYEGFPHVVVEACSVGLPCIVSDRGGNPETKNFFPDLVTVAPYLDKEAWVDAMKLIIMNEELRNSDVVRGTRDAVRGTDVLSFSRMVDETLEALKSNL
ncbi:MAG: glycosyltransferase family 4 protein [Patescibacteria group bacterium]|nr:glycosyltransferase family 4 protein [Patescibacteria group bacterium]